MRPAQLRPLLKLMIEAREPVFLWGPPGVGKSDVVALVAADMNLELRDVRLPLMEPVDAKGFPIPDLAKNVMRWLPADFLPKKGKGLLFLDEMNAAPQSVQAAFYQLILNRRIGEYVLPEGWAVVAAGNRAGDRSVVHAQPAALANRFCHMDFEVNLDDWSDWAMTNNVDMRVRAFLRFRPALLCPAIEPGAVRAFPTPRTWAKLAKVYDQAPRELRNELVRGYVGDAAAGEFIAFITQLQDLPNVNEVYTIPDKARLPEQSGAQYAIALAASEIATPGNFNRGLKYMERLSVEFQILYVRHCLLKDDKIANTKEYLDWGLKNQSVMM